MKPTCWWLAPVLLALGGASGARADTRPGVAEGFPNYEERPLQEASTPLVQPARVDPPAVCAGAVVTLLPPPGSTFAPPTPARACSSLPAASRARWWSGSRPASGSRCPARP